MEYLKLLGILIVIIGFALKKDPILIIICSAIVTAIVGNMSVRGLLETMGTSFVANRSMAVFILVLLVTGTLERNGLKESAARLIGKMKKASAGAVISAYGVMRVIFAAFNVSFGGVAGFVRPVIMPMAVGAVEADGKKANEEHVEKIKGMAAGMENITWFFGQVLFVGGAGGLLVQATLKDLGYHVELIDLVKVEIPVAIVATVVTIIYYNVLDKKMCKKYYGDEPAKAEKK